MQRTLYRKDRSPHRVTRLYCVAMRRLKMDKSIGDRRALSHFRDFHAYIDGDEHTQRKAVSLLQRAAP